MAINLLLPSITEAIKNLNVTWVTIKDYDGITASWQSRPNVLYPNPEGFITEFGLEYPSMLRGASAFVNVSYTLNYRFLGSELGDLSQMPQQYKEMIDRVSDIIENLMETHAPYSGAVDMEVASVSVGARADPAGNLFHGADIAVRITEMQNL